MDLDLSKYRKVITLLVTAGIAMAMYRYGIDIRDLTVYGLNVTGLAEPIADFIVTIGMPAVFALAQPNEPGESLWTYWRWIAVGLVAVLGLLAFVVLVL
jgi:hypothetical protein